METFYDIDIPLVIEAALIVFAAGIVLVAIVLAWYSSGKR